MKILFISNYLPYPPDTGTKMRSMNFLRYLAKKGEVTLIAPGDPITDAKHVIELKSLCTNVVLIDSQTYGPHSTANKKFSFSERVNQLTEMKPWALQDFMSEEFKQKLISLNPQSFDLIFIRYAQPAYYFLTDPRLRSLLWRIVIDVDDISINMQERHIQEMSFSYGKIRNILDLMFLKNYYRKIKDVRACLITNDQDKQYLLEEGFSKNVFVIPNTIEVNRAHVNVQNVRDPEILFCGTLSFPHNEKAAFYFCHEVFPKIRSAIPNAQLSIVGKNPTAKVLKLNSISGVSVIGSVPSMEPYYKKSAIVVVPLLNGAGTRIKILEAMSYQKPVVSTSVGAEGLSVTDSENIYLADDPSLFAKRCVELLQDSERRISLGARGYEFVKANYDEKVFDKTMDDFFNFFQQAEPCRR